MAFGPVSIGGSSYVLPPATKESLGGVIVGDDLTVDEQGKINLPIATATTLGGIKSGKGLEIRADGTASIDAYNTAEIDSMLNALQEQVDSKISSATSIAASGSNYIRFTDGTQICWGRSNGKYSSARKFIHPVPFVDANYYIGTAYYGTTIYEDTCTYVGYGNNSWISSASINAPTTTYCVVAGTGIEARYIAVGRWK